MKSSLRLALEEEAKAARRARQDLLAENEVLRRHGGALGWGGPGGAGGEAIRKWLVWVGLVWAGVG